MSVAAPLVSRAYDSAVNGDVCTARMGANKAWFSTPFQYFGLTRCWRTSVSHRRLGQTGPVSLRAHRIASNAPSGIRSASAGRLRPGLVSAVPFQEELFGPVLSLLRPGSLDEALVWLNRLPYGNGATIFSRSGAAVREFARRINCGMVGVNVGVPAPMVVFPFSGWGKASFFIPGRRSSCPAGI